MISEICFCGYRCDKIYMEKPSLPVRSKALPTAPVLLQTGAVFVYGS